MEDFSEWRKWLPVGRGAKMGMEWKDNLPREFHHPGQTLLPSCLSDIQLLLLSFSAAPLCSPASGAWGFYGYRVGGGAGQGGFGKGNIRVGKQGREVLI